jgi:hypothetical protein
MLDANRLAEAQDHFVRELPDMLRIALWAFKHEDPEKREDHAWIVVELCWKYWVVLYERGQADMLRPCLSFAIRQARAGRDVCRACRPPAVLEIPWESLPYEVMSQRMPPDDEVQLRLDVRAWQDSLRPIDAALASQLGNGERVTDVARELNVTPGRISQRRDALIRSWRSFTADPDTAA